MKVLKIASIGLLGVLAVVLAAGTVIEKISGEFHYTSAAMIALWALVALSSISYMVRCRLWHRPALMLLHGALLVILLGAAVTCFTKAEGQLVLNQGEPQHCYVADNGTQVELPFSVTLQQFSVVSYPATNTPANFVSQLSISSQIGTTTGSVSINQPLNIGGYRLSQQGYTPELNRSILSVSYDPMGIPITYTGYALLILSIIVYLASPHTRLRATIRQLRMSVVMAAILGSPFCITAQTVPHDIANHFGDIMVLYNGRVCATHTLARDFTMKVCGTISPSGLSCEQVFVSWMLSPHSWNQKAIIKTNRELARLGIGDGKHAAYNDFFDASGHYRLEEQHPDSRKYAEKLDLINSLTEGRLMKLFAHANGNSIEWRGFGDELPGDIAPDEALFMRQSMGYLNSLIIAGNNNKANYVIDKIIAHQRKTCGDALPSSTKISAENIYNNLSNIRIDAIACLLMAILGIACYSMRSRNRIVWFLCNIMAWAVALHLTLLLALRWWVSTHVPLSNGFETMLFMAWCSFPLSLLMRSRMLPRTLLSLPVSGMCLMVASMSRMNPQITPLVPVLQSPLLCLHVAIVMLAYCLLAMTMLLGIIAILMRFTRHSNPYTLQHLALASQAALIVGVLMLAAGIFVGAIWANISWGRYWGWDPKEVWALITLIVYAMPLHIRRLTANANPMALHCYMVVAFLTVIITYFGVNYLLGGLHSYA
ncbi:MAG: cytochrome c biogenesis protein CcsA [Muribaculaceae bacterium]